MALQWEQISVDASDPEKLGQWWSAALSWKIVFSDANECEIRPDDGTTPGLLFIRVPDTKVSKNRLHLDLRPDNQAAEVSRFIALGASHVDIGQGDVSWVVLSDPEGNEFCVLRDNVSH
jgi:hypothetical protein